MSEICFSKKARKYQAEGNIYNAYFYFGAGLTPFKMQLLLHIMVSNHGGDKEPKTDQIEHVNKGMTYR